jgi:hypothetical protein
MNTEATVVGYGYKASHRCPSCTVRRVLRDMVIEGHGLSYVASEALERLAITRGFDWMDETSFDMDDFPKVVFRFQVEDGETCDDCGVILATVPDRATWNDKAVDYGFPRDITEALGPRHD